MKCVGCGNEFEPFLENSVLCLNCEDVILRWYLYRETGKKDFIQDVLEVYELKHMKEINDKFCLHKK